ncbi:hypothetical protein ABPG72_000042 [Tetrahymena utriculariae]
MNTFGQNFNLNKVLKETDYTKRKTKIVCTLGPQSSSVEMICKLLDSGMNVARITYCYGLKQFYETVISNLKQAFKLRKSIQCSIMLDTRGPDIRTSLLKDKKPIEIKKGQKFKIMDEQPEYQGDEQGIGCSIALSKLVQVGQHVLLSDNTIYSHVVEVNESDIIVQFENEGILSEVKNVRLPGVKVDLPTISEEDEDFIISQGLEKGVDFIAVSFIRNGEDIEYVRDLLSPRGEHIKIIAKIENIEGMENFEDILKSADGIMVARGDLGMVIPPQKVFVAQKWMIDRCLEVGKPVITATQMMESMVKNPKPTRAEASDVANAVLDGTDAVMLSTETSVGQYPCECVEITSQISREAEMCYNNADNFFKRTKMIREISDTESMATSAVQMSFDLKAPIIVVFTMYGEMARLISKYRPTAHIIVVSNEPATIKALTLSHGIISLKVPSFQGIEKLIDYAINRAKELNLCKKGDKVIVVMGSEEEDQDQSDILKVKTVT